MLKTLIEYDRLTGEIRCVRTFDARAVPPQPCAEGCAHRRLLGELGEQIKRNMTRYRVHPQTARLEREEKAGRWKSVEEDRDMKIYFVWYNRHGQIVNGPIEVPTETDFQRHEQGLGCRKLKVTRQEAEDLAFEGIERWEVADAESAAPRLRRKE